MPRTALAAPRRARSGPRRCSSRLACHAAPAYANPATRSEYVSQLAVGGEDGTLRNRLKDLPRPRIVRAKTGTLDDVIALSGYVLGPTPDRALAFSILLNGIGGKQWQARALADDLVRALAKHLYPAK
jgi:D-alanyl-D-alanine carboxypeptidase/D-alanyl-D-alanine-endopeptidase (penicillin-binding protein 4)